MPLDQLGDRRNDTHERGLALARDLDIEALARDEHVEASGALERRASSDFEIPDAVGERSLAVAFRDVEGDRCRRLVEMLEHVRAPTARLHLVENWADPRAKGDRESIRVELFVIEHAAVIGRGGQKLRIEYAHERAARCP